MSWTPWAIDTDRGPTDEFAMETINATTSERLEVTFYLGEMDGKPVVQVDGAGDFRVNVNDGTVFDRHTDSNSLMDGAALAMYHLNVGYGANPFAHYTLAELHQLRREFLNAGFSSATVDAKGMLAPIACIVCDRDDEALSDAGLCTNCEDQEQGAPA